MKRPRSSVLVYSSVSHNDTVSMIKLFSQTFVLSFMFNVNKWRKTQKLSKLSPPTTWPMLFKFLFFSRLSFISLPRHQPHTRHRRVPALISKKVSILTPKITHVSQVKNVKICKIATLTIQIYTNTIHFAYNFLLFPYISWSIKKIANGSYCVKKEK